MQDFAAIVKAARLRSGLTLQALAGKLGTHKGYCSGIENRKVNPPSAKVIRKMAKLLVLDVQELLIHATADKAPKEIRELVREGALGMLETSRKHGVTVVKPKEIVQAATA